MAGQQAYGYQWANSYNTHDWNRLYHYPYVWYPQNYYADGYMIFIIAILRKCGYPSTIDRGKIITQNLVGTTRAIIFNLMYSDIVLPISEIL